MDNRVPLSMSYSVCSDCGAFAEGAAAEALGYFCPACGGLFEATVASPDRSDPWEWPPFRVRPLAAGEDYSNPGARVVMA